MRGQGQEDWRSPCAHPAHPQAPLPPSRVEGGARMMRTSHTGVPASPMRLLEMLTDRFGVFEALAHSTIKLNRCTSADELSMDPQVAEAVLKLADDLRTARAASGAWAESTGLVHG